MSPCTPTRDPRAQIANSASSPGAFQHGQERWQRFSVYFPAGFPKFMDSSSSDQWFLFQEDYGAPWNGSPPISFGVVNDQLIAARGAQYGYDWVWSKPLQRDHWYTFIVHKRFAKDSSGFVELWLDGVQQRFSPDPTARRRVMPA